MNTPIDNIHPIWINKNPFRVGATVLRLSAVELYQWSKYLNQFIRVGAGRLLLLVVKLPHDLIKLFQPLVIFKYFY